MINAGFNPLQTMAEKTGKSIGELKKEMEGGNVTFDKVIEAFKDATSEGGRFYGMLDKQSQKAGGAIAKALAPLLRSLSDLLTALNESYPGVVGFVGVVTLLTTALTVLKITGLTGAIASLMTWTPTMVAAAPTGGFTGTVAAATVAAKAFFASLGPEGWAIVIHGTLATAWTAVSLATADATKEQDKYNNAKQRGLGFEQKIKMMTLPELKQELQHNKDLVTLQDKKIENYKKIAGVSDALKSHVALLKNEQDLLNKEIELRKNQTPIITDNNVEKQKLITTEEELRNKLEEVNAEINRTNLTEFDKNQYMALRL